MPGVVWVYYTKSKEYLHKNGRRNAHHRKHLRPSLSTPGQLTYHYTTHRQSDGKADPSQSKQASLSSFPRKPLPNRSVLNHQKRVHIFLQALRRLRPIILKVRVSVHRPLYPPIRPARPELRVQLVQTLPVLRHVIVVLEKIALVGGEIRFVLVPAGLGEVAGWRGGTDWHAGHFGKGVFGGRGCRVEFWGVGGRLGGEGEGCSEVGEVVDALA